MKRLTFMVNIDTDGDAEDLARCFEQYITTPGWNDLGFLSDYAADGVGAIQTGYEGPFVRSINVLRVDVQSSVEGKWAVFDAVTGAKYSDTFDTDSQASGLCGALNTREAGGRYHVRQCINGRWERR